jgi:hypothetical protein
MIWGLVGARGSDWNLLPIEVRLFEFLRPRSFISSSNVIQDGMSPIIFMTQLGKWT